MDWFGFANYIKTDSLYSATLNSTTSDSATLNIAVTTSASLKLCNIKIVQHQIVQY